MKFVSLAAFGAIALAGLAPVLVTPAAAQRTVVTERTVVRDRPVARRWHDRRVCRTEWRHHHRVRVCRTVRHR